MERSSTLYPDRHDLCALGVFRRITVGYPEAVPWLAEHPGNAILAEIRRDGGISVALYWLEIKCPHCGSVFSANRSAWDFVEGNLQSLNYDPKSPNECSLIDGETARLVKFTMDDEEFWDRCIVENDIDGEHLLILFEGSPFDLHRLPAGSRTIEKAPDVTALDRGDFAIIQAMELIDHELPDGGSAEDVLKLNGYIHGLQRCPLCNGETEIIAGHEELLPRSESAPYEKLRTRCSLCPTNPLTIKADDRRLAIDFDFHGDRHSCAFTFDCGHVELDGLRLFRDPRSDEAVFRSCRYKHVSADGGLFSEDDGATVDNYLESLLKLPSIFDDEGIYRCIQERFPSYIDIPAYRQDGMNFLNLALHHRFRNYPSDFYGSLLQSGSLPTCPRGPEVEKKDTRPTCILFECSVLPCRYEDLEAFYDSLGFPLKTDIRETLIKVPIKLVELARFNDLPFENAHVLERFLALPNYNELLDDLSTREVSFVPLRFVGRLVGEEQLLRFIDRNKPPLAEYFADLTIAPFQRALDDPASIPDELLDVLSYSNIFQILQNMSVWERWLEHGAGSFKLFSHR